MKVMFLIVYMFPFFISGQEHNALEDFSFLIGNWQGVESGVPGNGIGFRTYSWELNKNYIMLKNASHFPKSDKKPIGEVHRDIGIISYNSNDSSIVLREFHVEGFVNIYLFDQSISNDSTFIFITREIENNPGNWVARSTLRKRSDKEFWEIFEIATDGKNFKELLRNHWHKAD